MARVRITRHARERAEEMCIEIGPRRLSMHIQGALKAGLSVRRDGSISVSIGEGRSAICRPDAWGGWAVVTFIGERGA